MVVPLIPNHHGRDAGVVEGMHPVVSVGRFGEPLFQVTVGGLGSDLLGGLQVGEDVAGDVITDWVPVLIPGVLVSVVIGLWCA